MKLIKAFSVAIAALTVFAACDKTSKIPVEARLSIDGESSFTLDSKTQTVSVSIVSSRDWTAKPNVDWISVSPESGSAASGAQKVEITVLENTSYDREGTIKFSIGTMSKNVTVKQSGVASAPDGTKENPFDIASAIAKCQEIGETESTEKYYVKGVITSIKEVDTGSYGNASFYISDTGAEGETTFYVYHCYYLGGEKFTSADQIKVGDNVIICAPLLNYKGNTPETGKGAAIYSLNGEVSEVNGGGDGPTGQAKGTGTADDPFNPTAAIQKCIEIGQTASTEAFYVKGIISKGLNISTSYGNATFYISEDGTTTSDQFYIFRTMSFNGEKFASESQLAIGDEVVVKGQLVNYYGNTPEMTQGGELISVNGGQEVTDYLSISPASTEVSSAAGSFTVAVTSNTSWTVVSSGFLSVDKNSGNGNGEVVVSYTANTTGAARKATIAFLGADKTITLTVNQLEEGAAQAYKLTWASADWNVTDPQNIVLEKGGYKVVVKKNAGSTNPAVRDNGDIRAYAKATIEVTAPTAISSLVFNLASDAGFRLAAVTADSGEVAEQAVGDKEVRWSGNATTVTFTVGDTAKYGSDGEANAGQLRFSSITLK